MVLSFDASGTVSACDPTAPDYVFAGISTAAFAAGDQVTAVHTGFMTDSAWSWTPQMPIFAAPNGQMSQTAPSCGTLHRIATAMSPTAIVVSPRTTVLRQ